VKGGATDFLCKPIDHEELGRVLNRVLQQGNVERNTARPVPPPRSFTSRNAAVQETQTRVGPVSRSGVPVLIQGETGSGKEVLARELHAQSPRANKPFMKLNCAALPMELVESELFGYERGAFTGAHQKKLGMFELADGGTLLLDEIGDMDIRLQAKLLQVLQDQEFRRVGGKELIRVDVRVISATHRDLERAIFDGSFREDLYYRLNVVCLHVLPLRERAEDIVPLGQFLIRRYALPGAPLPAISAELEHAMLAYAWPGNVRELENCMRNLVIFPDSERMARELRAKSARKPARSGSPLDPAGTLPAAKTEPVSVLEQVSKVKTRAETDAILAALNSTRWNRKQAAAILKIDYKSLLYKMKKLAIDDLPATPTE
jgi:two-component system response regulator AtoC